MAVGVKCLQCNEFMAYEEYGKYWYRCLKCGLYCPDSFATRNQAIKKVTFIWYLGYWRSTATASYKIRI